jgi:hypothetical protein
MFLRMDRLLVFHPGAVRPRPRPLQNQRDYYAVPTSSVQLSTPISAPPLLTAFCLCFLTRHFCRTLTEGNARARTRLAMARAARGR